SEYKKEKTLLNADNTGKEDIQTPSEKSSKFIFNPHALKHTPTFEELYPNYQGFFSELLKWKKKYGTWKGAYRHVKGLTRLKKKQNKCNR
ncbi:MAG: hypothetical protein HUJ63_02375, partial [Enterococcus sp.]|nr:hypothetical protein [Enterococcus sp.]